MSSDPDDDAAGQTVMTRRQLMRHTGAATVAGGGLYASGLGTRESEAIAVTTAIGIGVAGVAAGAIGGYAARELEIIGSDDGVDKELVQDQWVQDFYETIQTRESTNESTMVGKENVAEFSSDTALSEAKIEGIKRMQEQAPEQEVMDDGIAVIEDYYDTVQRNLLVAWAESVQELENLYSSAQDNPDISLSDIFAQQSVLNDGTSWDQLKFSSVSVTLYSGKTLDQIEVQRPDNNDNNPSLSIKDVEIWVDGDGNVGNYNPTGIGGYANNNSVKTGINGFDDVKYLIASEWRDTWDKITEEADEVVTRYTTWVENGYQEVQDGNIRVEDLIGPAELARMQAEDNPERAAISDLVALNVPTTWDGQARLRTERGTEIPALVSSTDTDGSISEGESVDPSSSSEDYYATFNLRNYRREWTHYDETKGVDGGVIHFTKDPKRLPDGSSAEGVLIYRVRTNRGETAEVQPSEFSKLSGEQTWEADISNKLNNQIAEIESVTAVSTTDQNYWMTTEMTEEFSVEETGTDSETLSFDRARTPQTDSNFTSNDEWQENQDRQEEITEEYVEQTNDGGGIGLPNLGSGGLAGIVGALGTAAFLLVILFVVSLVNLAGGDADLEDYR